jgi:hypothetical protein
MSDLALGVLGSVCVLGEDVRIKVLELEAFSLGIISIDACGGVAGASSHCSTQLT